MTRSLSFLVCLFFSVPSWGADHEKGDSMSLRIHSPGAIKWQEGPKSIPPGAKQAILEGDPAKEGPFVVRLKFPDGYRVMPHTHAKPERVTIISGTLYIGMGGKFDASKTLPMPAGSFGMWPPGMKHFGWFKGETIIQLHGVGPWVIEYLDPADDPRNAKKKRGTATNLAISRIHGSLDFLGAASAVRPDR